MKNDTSLILLMTYIRNVLDLNNDVRVGVEEYSRLGKDRKRIIIDFPSIESCASKVSQWAAWKNAYKHRKR